MGGGVMYEKCVLEGMWLMARGVVCVRQSEESLVSVLTRPYLVHARQFVCKRKEACVYMASFPASTAFSRCLSMDASHALEWMLRGRSRRRRGRRGTKKRDICKPMWGVLLCCKPTGSTVSVPAVLLLVFEINFENIKRQKAISDYEGPPRGGPPPCPCLVFEPVEW